MGLENESKGTWKCIKLFQNWKEKYEIPRKKKEVIKWDSQDFSWATKLEKTKQKNDRETVSKLFITKYVRNICMTMTINTHLLYYSS